MAMSRSAPDEMDAAAIAVAPQKEKGAEVSSRASPFQSRCD
jgi:hypothetical protein